MSKTENPAPSPNLTALLAAADAWDREISDFDPSDPERIWRVKARDAIRHHNKDQDERARVKALEEAAVIVSDYAGKQSQIAAAIRALITTPSPETNSASRAGSPGSGQPLGSDREPAPQASQDELVPSSSHRRGIYIASKTKHADRWRRLRDDAGLPIISTWIDEAGAGESGDLSDLWRRCILEASTASALVLYREPDDVLKGGWVELGAALACGVPVFAVGIEEFTIARDKRIRHFATLDAALAATATEGSDRG